MKVVFYTAVCFLDISLEMINVLKKFVDLHVIIEISEGSKKQNILDIETLPKNRALVHPSLVMTPESYQPIAPYLDGSASVNFLVFPSKDPLKIAGISIIATKFIKHIAPDVIHIEGTLIRSLAILPAFLFCKKLVMGIHDPVFHKGEQDWKMSFTRFMFKSFPIKRSLLFYSHYAEQQYSLHYKTSKSPHWVIAMKPYSYFTKLVKDEPVKKDYILFFGRLSVYKGIDVLLQAMAKLLAKLPNEKLTIAGNSYRNYKVDGQLPNKYPDNVKVVDKHIPNKDLVALIASAKFVVCPYLEATQSGVLMTAFALNTPVIASDTGAFSEFIEEKITGFLVPPGDANALANAMDQMLENDFYKVLSDNLKAKNRKDSWQENSDVLLKAYTT